MSQTAVSFDSVSVGTVFRSAGDSTLYVKVSPRFFRIVGSRSALVHPKTDLHDSLIFPTGDVLTGPYTDQLPFDVQRNAWTVAELRNLDASELPTVPVVVDGFPMIRRGKIVPNGNRPYVVVDSVRPTAEQWFSWEAIEQALNVPGHALPIEQRRERLPATPYVFEECKPF